MKFKEQLPGDNPADPTKRPEDQQPGTPDETKKPEPGTKPQQPRP